jgi:hypothetical protein
MKNSDVSDNYFSEIRSGYYNNLECISSERRNFQKRKKKNKALEYLFIVSFLILIISLIVLIFVDLELSKQSLFGYFGLFSSFILFFFLKKIIRNNVFYGFNDFPFQDPTRAYQKPYSYIECQFRRGLVNESFTLPNKFFSDNDAFDFLSRKVEIEFEEWCFDKNNKKITGYILHERSWEKSNECDILVTFQIKNTFESALFSNFPR